MADSAATTARARWRHRLFLLPVLLAAGCLSSTAPEAPLALRVGGPCRYDVAVGVARILEVRVAAAAVEMRVGVTMPAAFRPAEGWQQRELALAVAGPAAGADAAWLATQGIRVGVAYPVELSVIREGTCTPVMLRFPGRPWQVL